MNVGDTWTDSDGNEMRVVSVDEQSQENGSTVTVTASEPV